MHTSLDLPELKDSGYDKFSKQFGAAYKEELTTNRDFSLIFYDIRKAAQSGIVYDDLADTITRRYLGAPKHQYFDPSLPIVNSYAPATEDNLIESFPIALQRGLYNTTPIPIDLSRKDVIAFVKLFNEPRKVYSFNPAQGDVIGGEAFIVMDKEKAGVLYVGMTD